MFANPFPDPSRDRFRHHLRAPRRGINMAVRAGLVAFAADIELQRLQPVAAQGQPVPGQFGIKAVHGVTQ
jgi:hypothetical protein